LDLWNKLIRNKTAKALLFATFRFICLNQFQFYSNLKLNLNSNLNLKSNLNKIEIGLSQNKPKCLINRMFSSIWLFYLWSNNTLLPELMFNWLYDWRKSWCSILYFE